MLEINEKSQALRTSSTSDSGEGCSDYVDLAPTDKADPSGIYSEALLEATSNPNVFNIALTGPYGSGKSSIIRTFLKSYEKDRFAKNKVLQISLAAFLPETSPAKGAKSSSKTASDDKNVSKQEIERSILQQMLYGADANSLPLSRFKRIQSPGKLRSQSVALFIVLGMLACWYLIQNQTSIFDSSFYQHLDQTNWFNIACVALGGLFVWQIIHQVYIRSLGVSLKAISLKDIELKPQAAEEESILNRHLDEIIYFFQCTDYDLVVIEDLDRFNNPDIFVTLREINSLINANVGVKRQIRFLYALRDNMFVNTDRTKFFEFIVPVIPIINSSNSIDKIIEQGDRLSLTERLDGQFLREVSRYLNDLRLIQNIFNEYAIYLKNLDTEKEYILDPNKLLAVLIYKNVIPSDFEELHREKGDLAEILGRHELLITRAERSYKLQISELEQQISNAEKQVPSDLSELRKIYAMALIGRIPQGYAFIEFNGNMTTPIQSLSDHEKFDDLLEVKNIMCRSTQNQRHSVSLVGLQDEVDAEKTYQERKKLIELRSSEFKDNASKTIKELRAKISTLRMTKFNELIRTDTEGSTELFEAFGESKELVKFLVFEGFLDDTYYQYTSLFHSGRLSPNDNKYLIQIRAFNNPEPDCQIDNPKEVIAAMRDDDFGRHFILNVILVDCMLSSPAKYSHQIKRLLEFISSKFEECDAFFSTYYQRGKHVSELISRLLDKWPGFVSAALGSADSIIHVSRLVAFLPEIQLKSLHQKDDQISEFISTNLSEVLRQEVDFDPARLKLISFEVQDLETLRSYPAIVRLLTDEGLYNVSIQNIEFIFRDVLALPSVEELDRKNYSTILKSGFEPLISKIEGDFERYLRSVLLQLENNTEEDVSAIISVLAHDEINSEYLSAFLEMQLSNLPTIDEVPTRFHKEVFAQHKIEATWANCQGFMASDAYDAEILTEFLKSENAIIALSQVAIDIDKATLKLRQFLFGNNDFDSETYRNYLKAITHKFSAFPKKIDPEKLLVSVQEGQVVFSPESFAQLAGYPEYQVLFVERNIGSYFKIKDQISLDDTFLEKLLSSDIADDEKMRVIDDMDLSLIVGLPERASIVGEIFYRTNADVTQLAPEVAQALVVNSAPVEVQIALLNKCQSVLSNDEIRQTLQQMPEPFPDFGPGYKRPTLLRNDANVELVKWMDKRKIISSWKEFLRDIWVYNYRP